MIAFHSSIGLRRTGSDDRDTQVLVHAPELRHPSSPALLPGAWLFRRIHILPVRVRRTRHPVVRSTCRTPYLRWTIQGTCLGRILWRNTGNRDIRTMIAHRVRNRPRGSRLRSARAVRRDGTTRWARGQSIFRARGRCRDARSVAPCCRGRRRVGSARSVDSSCIRASSAPISIPAAGSSACSR